MEITHNTDGTATITLPENLIPAVERAVSLQRRNDAIVARFMELRGTMKTQDIFRLIEQELSSQGIILGIASLHRIVYPLPEEPAQS